MLRMLSQQEDTAQYLHGGPGRGETGGFRFVKPPQVNGNFPERMPDITTRVNVSR